MNVSLINFREIITNGEMGKHIYINNNNKEYRASEVVLCYTRKGTVPL